MVSLRSIIRTFPLVARGGMLARLTPRSLLLAHSPCSYARFRSTSAFASTSLFRPRSLWSHGLLSGVALLQFKTPVDLSYHSY